MLDIQVHFSYSLTNPSKSQDKAIILNMSGRGDKDLFILAPQLDRDKWLTFLSNEVAAHSRQQREG